MQSELEYGPRLTDAEYEKQIVSLYRSLPPMPSPEQDQKTRQQELNLAIDHRLGRGFPEERRAALWAVQQRIEKKRLSLAAKYLLRRFVSGLLIRHAQSLAGYAAAEYAKVLSPEEVRRFLDLKQGERPTLPVDIDHFQK